MIPSVALNVLDGGLGVVAANTDQLAVVMGPSSMGDVAAPTLITSAGALLSAFGYGPGVSLALACTQTSGLPVLFCRTATDVAGSAGSVTHTGTGLSEMSVTAVGGGTAQPFDGGELLVTIAPGSAAVVGGGVVRASVSIDNGLTTLGTFVVSAASPYKIALDALGIELRFTAASVVVGDTYACLLTAPLSVVSSVTAAMDAAAAIAAPVPSMFFDAGQRSEADCLLLEAKMIELSSDPSIALPARLVTSSQIGLSAAALAAAFAPLGAVHVGVGGGSARMYDYAQKAYLVRPFAWSAMARLVSVDAHTDAGQVSLGPLPGVLSVSADQRLDATLDTARFIAPISFRGLQGFYVANPNLMAPTGSDYQLIQYGRVMDKVCRTARAYFLRALSSSVRLNPATGYILEKDALSLEQGCDAALRATVIASGDVSSVQTQVSRTDNISATKTIHVTVRVLPLGYLKHIDVTLSFVNPANALPTA